MVHCLSLYSLTLTLFGVERKLARERISQMEPIHILNFHMSYALIVEGLAQNQGTPTVTTPLPLATPVPSGPSGTGTSYRQ